MPEAEEIPQGAQDARVVGVVPGDPDQAVPVMPRLGHPDMREATRTIDIRQDPGFTRGDGPAVRIPSTGVPRGNPPGRAILNQGNIVKHGRSFLRPGHQAGRVPCSTTRQHPAPVQSWITRKYSAPVVTGCA